MIYQYDKNGILCGEFNNLEQASSFTGITPRKIKRCLKGETKSAEGYVFNELIIESSYNPELAASIKSASLYDNYNTKSYNGEFDRMREEIAILRAELSKVSKSNKLSSAKTAPIEEPKKRVAPFTGGHKGNVLVVGDIHEPFCREGYLEHCRNVQEQFNCGTVVFIGDVIDNHYSSYHETDPDGKSAGDELEHAISKIQEWYYTFPEAKVCIGNHDAIITRKALSSGVSNKWIRRYSEVLETPNWDFNMSFDIDGVHYYHGTGSSGEKAALNRAMNLRQPVVQGHIHTVAGIQYNASNKDLIWGMQVGCGTDDTKYAFAYAQSNIKKSIISCGVVLGGKLPVILPMDLPTRM